MSPALLFLLACWVGLFLAIVAEGWLQWRKGATSPDVADLEREMRRIERENRIARLEVECQIATEEKS